MIFEPEMIKCLLGARIPITVFADRNKFDQGPLVDKLDEFNCNVVYQSKFGSLDYGVFHSKLMLLEFDDRLRVVVSSANLYMHDWLHMSQVIWLQDFWPVSLESNEEEEKKDKPKSDFKEYLAHFMQCACPVKDHNLVYRQKIDLNKFDFTPAAV